MTFRTQQTSLLQFFTGQAHVQTAATKPGQAGKGRAKAKSTKQSERDINGKVAGFILSKQWDSTDMHHHLPEAKNPGLCTGAKEVIKQLSSALGYPDHRVFKSAAETQRDGNQTTPGLDKVPVDGLEAAKGTATSEGAIGVSAEAVLGSDIVEDATAVNIPGTKRKRVETRDPGQELSTDLERQRAENIRRNMRVLAGLGIGAQILAPRKPQALANTSQGRKVSPKLQMPLRRSTRSIGVALKNSPVATTPMPFPQVGKTEQVVEPLHYDDSSVRKYVCRVQAEAECPADLTPEKIDSFQPVGQGYCDPLMMRVYALNRFQGSGADLLAAGGHAGRLAVYGLKERDDSWEKPASDCARADSQEGTAIEPLLAWKGGAGWISGVQFLTRQKGGATLLLTSSNDKSVVLWDIDKSSGSGEPRAVARTSTLHSNGIFGMHELGGQIATSSKDKSVAITAVCETGFSPVTILSGHHSAAVRAVHFRDLHHLADGSADCSVAISDLRLADPGSIHIESAHRTAINVVQWHPTNNHLLMSASHDRGIRLHDIRSPQQPLFTFTGHLGPGLAGSKSIYRPSFLAGGKYVASPGEQSQALSLYDTITGKTVSRGGLGFDATMTMAGANGGHLWVAAQGGFVQRYRGVASAPS